MGYALRRKRDKMLEGAGRLVKERKMTGLYKNVLPASGFYYVMNLFLPAIQVCA
jgi:hypothetical protein